MDIRKFYLKDHIGNIRQTLSESGVVQSAMGYYAFGGTMNSFVNGSIVDKYRFTSKERDLETGLDYFGARYYNPLYGRWMSVDPLAEKYPGLSPYNYCLNNPLKLSDPDGNEPIDKSDKPKLSAKEKQRHAKAELQVAKKVFHEFIAPPLLAGSEFTGQVGRVTMAVGVMTAQPEIIVAGSGISTGSSVLHAAVNAIDGLATDNGSKAWDGVAEGGISVVSHFAGAGIDGLGSLTPLGRSYMKASIDWYSDAMSFGVSQVINSSNNNQKKKANKNSARNTGNEKQN